MAADTNQVLKTSNLTAVHEVEQLQVQLRNAETLSRERQASIERANDALQRLTEDDLVQKKANKRLTGVNQAHKQESQKLTLELGFTVNRRRQSLHDPYWRSKMEDAARVINDLDAPLYLLRGTNASAVRYHC